MKRGALALAVAAVLTGATLATASASGTPAVSAKSPAAARAAAAGTALAPTLLLPDGPGHDVSAVLSYSGGAAAVGGKSTFADLTVTRFVDPASVFLHQRVATQAALAKGVALVLTAAGQTQPTMTMTLGGVTVSADQFSGAAGAPQESVSFHYSAIEIDYYTANGVGGFTDAKMCWNLKTQTATCPAPVH